MEGLGWCVCGFFPSRAVAGNAAVAPCDKKSKSSHYVVNRELTHFIFETTFVVSRHSIYHIIYVLGLAIWKYETNCCGYFNSDSNLLNLFYRTIFICILRHLIVMLVRTGG